MMMTSTHESPEEARSVLIVEDDAMVRRLLARHFAKTGAVVTEAGDVSEALAVFSSAGSRFDVVVTDVHLPDRTGLDLATEMRSSCPYQPIVFVTGDVDEDLARRALAGGKAGYLLKPFEFFELDAAVAQAMQTPALQQRHADSASSSEEQWLAEQRRVLLAASKSAVDMGKLTFPRRQPVSTVGVYVRIAAAIVVFIAVALTVGYGISSEPDSDSRATVEPETRRPRTVYVPDQAYPQSETKW